MTFQQLVSFCAINEANIKYHLRPKRVPKGKLTLTALQSVVRDKINQLVLERQPRSREEWRAISTSVRRSLRDRLTFSHTLWVKQGCAKYSMYPRGYAVALFSLLEVVKDYQVSHYNLTRQYIEVARKFAYLESQSAESPFRPIILKPQSNEVTLVSLNLASEDESEEEYSVNDSAWVSRKERELYESEDYDDFEFRQSFYESSFC